MSSVKIKKNNDAAIENNDLVLIEGRDEIAQVLRQRLRLFAGEFFLDTREGIPYYQDVLKKRPDPARVDAIFKNEILTSPGVIELINFQLDLQGRSLSLAFSARTQDGIIDFNEELI